MASKVFGAKVEQPLSKFGVTFGYLDSVPQHLDVVVHTLKALLRKVAQSNRLFSISILSVQKSHNVVKDYVDFGTKGKIQN